MNTTLAELTRRTGLDVLDHLDRALTIPVIDGLQAQGDLIVIPLSILDDVTVAATARVRLVPPSGIELLRGAAGGNPHTLVAEPDTCTWTTDVIDREGLALGVLDTTEVAYLIHPEHGGTGIAPGAYAIRRQRERAARRDSRTVLGSAGRRLRRRPSDGRSWPGNDVDIEAGSPIPRHCRRLSYAFARFGRSKPSAASIGAGHLTETVIDVVAFCRYQRI